MNKTKTFISSERILEMLNKDREEEEATMLNYTLKGIHVGMKELAKFESTDEMELELMNFYLDIKRKLAQHNTK